MAAAGAGAIDILVQSAVSGMHLQVCTPLPFQHGRLGLGCECSQPFTCPHTVPGFTGGGKGCSTCARLCLLQVRADGGIAPLVRLLNSWDLKVQRAAAGALRTLAFKNDDNKRQIVECGALPLLIQVCSFATLQRWPGDCSSAAGSERCGTLIELQNCKGGQ